MTNFNASRQTPPCWIHFTWTPSKNLLKACETLVNSDAAHAVARLEYTQKPLIAGILWALPKLDIRDLRVNVRLNRNPLENRNLETAQIEFPNLTGMWLPTEIRKVIIGMAGAHAYISQESNVRVRIATVRGTPCPRWHVDKVPLRGLCTMVGPGTVIWDSVEQSSMQLQSGDVLFLRGVYPENTYDQSALLHRSPHVESEVLKPRLVVQTDSWKM